MSKLGSCYTYIKRVKSENRSVKGEGKLNSDSNINEFVKPELDSTTLSRLNY